jgi:hypothetical protein
VNKKADVRKRNPFDFGVSEERIALADIRFFVHEFTQAGVVRNGISVSS